MGPAPISDINSATISVLRYSIVPGKWAIIPTDIPISTKGSGVTPEIRYAKSGDVHIAYQTFGHGAQDIVIIPGFISHIEHVWDSPEQSRWLNHLARRARVTRAAQNL